MEKYVKLSATVMFSSLWKEDSDHAKLWMTILAMKDEEGIVRTSVFQLEDAARIPLEKCRQILAKFFAPDLRSTTPDMEGRRLIERPDGSWQVVNHEKYQAYGWSDDKKAYERDRKAKYRAKKPKQPPAKGTPLPGETAFVKAEAAGASPEVLDKLSEPPERRHSIPTVEEVIGVGVTAGISEEDCRRWHKDRTVEGWADRNGCDIGNWRAYLLAYRDRKRVSGGNGNGIRPPSTVNELRTVKEAKEKLADRLKMRHANEDGLGVHWNDQEARGEYQTLRREIGELDAQIAGSR